MNERHPREHRLQRGRFARRRLVLVAHTRHRQHRAHIEARRDRVHDRRSRHVEEPAEGGAGNHRHLARRGARGDRLRQEPFGHQPRHHRLAGRRFRRACHAHEAHEDQNPHLVERARRTPDREQPGRQALDRLTRDDDAAALETIGGVPGRQRQEQRRRELHETHQAELEGAAREVVNLPADRDRQHLKGEAGRQPGSPELDERGVTTDGIERRRGWIGAGPL